MQRYFLAKHESLEITGPDAHHITKVMRMTSGEQVIVCADRQCFLVTLEIKEGRVFYHINEEIKREPDPQITLIQGLPKHPKTETVAKYATLFGASNIVFVPMMRSIAKSDNEANKLKRMHLIAKEAAELAHRFDIPEIRFETNLKNLDWSRFSVILLADENEKTKTLLEVLPEVNSNMSIALIIGPEGGIADQERSYLSSVGAHFVSLGKNILPTELASLYALSYLCLKNTETF
jgi:16S rRNA (uracil1498-N3)-methyltransferase